MSSETTEANIELVRTAREAFNAGDLDACLELVTPNLIQHLAELPEPRRGREVWREGAELLKHAFPDFRVEIEDIVAADDRVALRLTIRGTHSGEFLGIPATGRQVSYVSHEFYRVENGLIAEEWICSDTAGLFRQLS
jgi:steroid delta-isomerase-like uncharacterized protein